MQPLNIICVEFKKKKKISTSAIILIIRYAPPNLRTYKTQVYNITNCEPLPSPKYEKLKISVKRDTLKSARISGIGARVESKLGVLSIDCYAGTTLAT